MDERKEAWHDRSKAFVTEATVPGGSLVATTTNGTSCTQAIGAVHTYITLTSLISHY